MDLVQSIPNLAGLHQLHLPTAPPSPLPPDSSECKGSSDSFRNIYMYFITDHVSHCFVSINIEFHKTRITPVTALGVFALDLILTVLSTEIVNL